MGPMQLQHIPFWDGPWSEPAMVRYDEALTSCEQLLSLRLRKFRVLIALVAVFFM